MIIKLLPKYLSATMAILMVISVQAQTKVYDKVVAKDGTGDNTSISTAISSLGATKRVVFIKNGTYNEKILITTANVRLIGESVNGVIITYNDYSGKSVTSSSTADSYTVRVEGAGFYAENITFQNTATQAQAVAIYTKADTIAFKNCRFYGYQDTHYADDGHQYYLNCETRGDVDFIFGNAAVLYNKSTIISRNRKGGYVTAPSTTVITSAKNGGGTNYHGIAFKNCDIQAEAGLADNSCYLGRPWGASAASVFINCKIGTHIMPEGWSLWTAGDNNYTTAYFAEYNSNTPAGSILDVSQRVSWSKQLTISDTALYSISNYFKGWDPTIKTKALSAPNNVHFAGDSVKWNTVAGARGYAILRNDSVIGFSTTTAYVAKGFLVQNYRIKTVSRFGGLSDVSALAISTGIDALNQSNTNNYFVYVSNSILYTPENEKVEIYNITGALVKAVFYGKDLPLTELSSGIYIVKVTLDKSGTILVRKILK